MSSFDHSKDSLIRLPAVRRRTGLSTTTINRKIAAGQFPPKIALSPSMIAWYESDIDRWVADPTAWTAKA